MKLVNLLASAAFLLTCVGAQAQVVMNIDATQRGPMVSPWQYGLFFEEINHAGDGGLYAELVRNRSFEEGVAGWTAYNGAQLSTCTDGLLNSAQTTALDLYTEGASKKQLKGAMNEGFWGMKFEKDSTYTLSLWAKGKKNYTGKLWARLVSADGKNVIGEAAIQGSVNPNEWNKLTATIRATGTDLCGQLLLLTGNNGHLYVDVVSLFPYTWKNRRNGLRPDLAQLLADTRPRFLRFPGGCYVEGEGSWEQTFQWKKTIGPIEQRPGHMNQNWRYWSSDGLGFDEYLQLAEDMGAAPMFVVNVGLGHGYVIPWEDLDTLVQNTLDAIEYANGDATTKYGAMRIKNGHPAPYNLKFIEIGNENYNFYFDTNRDQSLQYPERYYKFYKAIKAKYPNIITIGNVESWGTDNPSWRNEYPVEMVDEHYYRAAGWMRDNYQKYDNYPRSISVYVGEYAANGGEWGRYGHLGAALGEAIFMLGMEKNSDVVRMGSFAPIFTHEKDPRWAYDMIHFNSGHNFVTPSYHVQKMFGHNVGTQNLRWTETGNELVEAAETPRQIGLATWNTHASFDDLMVSVSSADASNAKSVDGTTGATSRAVTSAYVSSDDIADDFSADQGWTVQSGTWRIADGVKQQTANGEPCITINKQQFTAPNYILKVRARKDDGAEGFLIIFDYKDEKNYSWWNIGGWGNTQHAVEVCRGGSKSTVVSKNGKLNSGQWYDVRVEVNGNHIKCFLDNKLVHDFTLPANRALYQSVQLDEKTQELILKVVNPNSKPQQLTVNTANMTLGAGTLQLLTSANNTDENSMDDPQCVVPAAVKAAPAANAGQLSLNIPAYSLNIYRYKVSNVGAEVKKVYPAYEKEDKNMYAYLYAHMSSQGEYTGYALSQYGQHWQAMLDGREVFDTKANTITGGMRDAYVLRRENGGFMLAGTDMTARLGWESNHIMDLMLSPDLVHWTKNVKIDLESPENLKAVSQVPEIQAAIHRTITAEEMTAAWAPQIIYDPQTKTYVIYYSVGYRVKFKNPKHNRLNYHRMFYQLIDEDLNILTEPRLYFDPGYDIIDDDIVWNDLDKQYVMIFKCEQTKGFDRATAKQLVPAKGAKGTTVWTVTPGYHLDENNENIEGPTQWRPMGSERWKLAYINYQRGYNYKVRDYDEHNLNHGAPIVLGGNVRAQHGSIVKITRQEYDYLKTWEQVLTLLPAIKEAQQKQPDAARAQAIATAEKALKESTTFEANVRAMNEALKALKKVE